MFAENIDNEDIKNLPPLCFSGETVIINSANFPSSLIDKFRTAEVIGFDTETKPSFKRGEIHQTALLQLSTGTTAILVKLKEVGIPNAIIELLESPSIIKVGAAIHDDIIGLKRVRNFKPNGFIDLQSIAPKFGIEEKSVRKMAAIILAGKVSKRQQLSNWELLQYSQSQIDYAATDAWVCREIYLKLKSINHQNVTL